MEVSKTILEWSARCRDLCSEIEQFERDFNSLQKGYYPFPDVAQLRTFAADNRRAVEVVEAWENLEQIWNSCPEQDVSSRFRELRNALNTGNYPEFIAKQLEEHVATALDANKTNILYDAAKLLGLKFRELVQYSQELTTSLTNYVFGKMVFSLTAESTENYQSQILDTNPLTYLSHQAHITDFPGQSMQSITERWLTAASQVGYDQFKLSRVINFRHDNKSIEGDLRSEVSPAINVSDFRDVDGVYILLNNTNLQDNIQNRTIRIDLSTRQGNICLDVDLLFRRDFSTDIFYIHEIGPILDKVAESYRT